VLGKQVDFIYGLPLDQIDATYAWIAIIAYSFQIYYDFSGYSDMAIGLGKIIGFKFPENFNNPYVSQNISEFWRRWHITLGEFMKYYLYIPLGGNRVSSKSKLYINLATVFLLSGLWHGASWNFVIWGAWHGLFLILDRIFLINLFSKINKSIRVAFTYIVVLVGWVFFRIEDFTTATQYIGKMFSFHFSNIPQFFDKEFLTTLIIGFIFAFITLLKPGKIWEQKIYSPQLTNGGHFLFLITSVLLLIICTAYITASGFNPFIYFRF
jgi:alginate O-acetyltransferase complex protein AlgI